MRAKPKYEVLAGIRTETTLVKGMRYQYFVADLGTFGGKRKRIRRPTKAEVIREIEDWYRQLASAGDSVYRLQPWQIDQAAEAFRLMDAAKCDEMLPVIVREWLERSHRKTQSVTVREAYETYYAKFAPQQEVQKGIIRARIGKFAAAFCDKIVCDINAKTVTDWLDGHDGWGPSTWNNNMKDIRTFFSWCMKKPNSWLAENPLEGVETKAVKAARPEYAKVEDVARLMEFLETWDDERRDAVLLRTILSFFCGMREAEIQRQDFDDIRIDDETLVVTESKGEQSGGRRRAFQIPPTALAWIKEVDLEHARMTWPIPCTWMKQREAAYKLAKVEMPQNAGRHSFITYDVAKEQSREHAMRVAGNSANMQRNHYDGLASKREGEAYFAIMPPVREIQGEERGE